MRNCSVMGDSDGRLPPDAELSKLHISTNWWEDSRDDFPDATGTGRSRLHKGHGSLASQAARVGYTRCPMKQKVQNRGGWAWPLGFAATIVVESSQSRVTMPADIWQADKIVHFLAFGLLATVTLRAMRVESPHWRAVAAVLLVSLFGASDEIHQRFTPGRSCDIFDWLADTLGARVRSGQGKWRRNRRCGFHNRLGNIFHGGAVLHA
jgi:hypothetical protein